MVATTLSKVISPDGTPIACYRAGAGPPLILVPGAGAANPAAWPVFPALTDHFTVYAVDRRGHGQSGDGPTYAIEREFEDIAAVVDSLGEPANVLGHSFGGLCALEAALRTPNIRRLVLYEPLSFPLPDRPLYPQGFIDRLEALLKTGDREGVMTIFYREIAGMSAEEIERFRSSPAWQERVATAATLPRELRADERYRLDAGRFSAMHTPALLLVGGNSRDFEVNASKALAAALPNSQIAVLPGQEHIAIYTAPDLFLQAVLAFLSR